MLWWFAQTTLIAGGLAVVATLAGRWKRLGPEARHALWLVVLIKLAIPPFVAWPWGLADAWPTRVEVAPTLVMAPEPAPAPIQAPSPPTVEISEPSPVESLPTNPFEDPGRSEVVAQVVEAPPLIREDVPSPPEPLGVRELAPAFESGSKLPHSKAPWSLIIDHGPSALLGLWLAGSVVVVVRRAVKVIRFHRSLADSQTAPDWLVEEARAIGERVGVRPPPMVATSSVGTPLLWCLGAPRLILPHALIKRLEADRWPGILAHELAHLARRDHWVVRLELLVEAIWWWNPLFWHTRRRLHSEAEHACDARVVRSLPERRFAYAEALVDVCEHLARTAIPSPSLGVGGAGASRSLEGRLLMILRDPIPRRPSRRAALAATLLAALALPAWTLGQQPDTPKPEAAPRPEVTPKPDTPKPDPSPRPEPAPSPVIAKPDVTPLSIEEVRQGFWKRQKLFKNLAMRYVVASQSESIRGQIRRHRVQVEAADVLYDFSVEIPGSSRLDVFYEAKPGSPTKPGEQSPTVPWARWLVIRNGPDVKSLRVESAGKGPAQFRWGAPGMRQGLAFGLLFSGETSLLSREAATSVNTIYSPDHRPLAVLDFDGPTSLIIAGGAVQASVAGVETIDGREAVRIAWISRNQGEARGICWLAPSLDFAVVRSDAFIDGPRDSTKPNTRWVWRKVASDFTKVADLWLPGKVTTRLSEVEFDGKTTVVREEVVTLEDYRVNAELPVTAFRAEFPIQAIDDKTGNFTTTPPEPPAGLIARLNRAVRESPFGPPVDEKTTLDLKVVATSQPGQPQLPPKLAIQTVPPGADAAKLDPGIIARTPPAFTDPIPIVKPKDDDPIPVKPPAVDPEFERQFKAEPEIAGLESMISEARKKLTDAQRMTRSPSDPARVAAQKKLESLTNSYNQLRESKLQEYTKEQSQSVLQARTNTEVYQARRDGKAAELQKAEAQRDIARVEFQNTEKLHKQNVVSRQEVDLFEGKLKFAEAEVAAKMAEVREADAFLNQARQHSGADNSPNPEPKAESRRAGDETALFQARRDAKAAELQKAEAHRELARAVVNRNERLQESNKAFVSREELDKASAELKVAEAEIAGKKAELAEADYFLNQARQHLGPATVPNPRSYFDLERLRPATVPNPRSYFDLANVSQPRRNDKAAEVEKSMDRLEKARAAVARSQEIVKAGKDITQDELTRVQKEVTVAEADLAARKAELHEADLLLNQSTRKPGPTALDSRDETALFQARRDGKAAELQKAEARLALAQADMNRASMLLARNAIDKKSVDQCTADLKVAEADVVLKKADLAEADFHLNQAGRRHGAPEAANPRTRADIPSSSSSTSTLPELRDAVELMEVQLQGKQAELRGAESKAALADKQWQRLKDLVQRGAVEPKLEDEAGDRVQTMKAELDVKKAEVQEFELRIKQAKRRAEVAEVLLRSDIERAKDRLNWIEDMLKKGLVSKGQAAADRARYEVLMFQLDPNYVPAAPSPAKP